MVDKLFEHKEEVGTIATTAVAIGAAVWKLLKKKKTDVNSCENCGLCRHKLFQIMDSFLANIDHPEWKCINTYKTEVAKDMIRTKFSTGKKRIKDWACKNKNVPDSKELCASFNDMIVAMIQEYENQWKALGVNHIIIDRLSLYHNQNAKYAVKFGKSELSRDYNNTKSSLHHVLDSLIIPYSMFIQDIRNVMDSFNGTLKDDVYKGIANDGKYIELEISRLQFSFEE